MKKRNYCYLLVLLFFIFCLIPMQTCNASGKDEYKITNYNVDIVVNENNVLDITETICVDFLVEKHGIYRDIPLTNRITRADGSTHTNYIQISNLWCSEPYSKSTSNGTLSLRFGSEDVTLTGPYEYQLSYSYDLGADPLKDEDELYFNIIGDGWDTTIDQLSFAIHMPKEFDESLLGFSSGELYTEGTDAVAYDVDGLDISGTYLDTLWPGEAFTVRLSLPEGYFTGSTRIDSLSLAALIISITFAILGFLLWFFLGRNSHVTETVEFYPPEGLNSAELSYIYHGKITNKGIFSLLLYLASKGYFGLEEESETPLSSKASNFRICLRKEYHGNNFIENLFFSGIAKHAGTKGYADSKDLKNNFYTTVDQIRKSFSKSTYTENIFCKGRRLYKTILLLMIIIVDIAITLGPVLSGGNPSLLIFALLFPGIGFSMLACTVFGNTEVSVKIFGFIWGIGFGGIPWITMVGVYLIQRPIYIVTYIIGIICIVLLAVCVKFMRKRTPEGNELYGKIKGFRHFLETAEKARLEALVSDNPEYFFDILPYTYALDISDKWVEKFDSILMTEPEWYQSSQEHFHATSFHRSMNHAMSRMGATMTSSPSSSSSSGHSGGGGGHSGGGSGGGGGHSW